MANTLNLFCNGAVGFIDWLDLLSSRSDKYSTRIFPMAIDALNDVVCSAFISLSRNIVKVDFVLIDDVDLKWLSPTRYIRSNSGTNIGGGDVVSSAGNRRTANGDARCNCTLDRHDQCHRQQAHRSNENSAPKICN